jgi:uncharacterized protein YndB with AHSA1/START domain
MNHEILISASPHRVFSFLAEPERLPLWMDGLEESVYPPDFCADAPVGVTFQQRMTQAGRTVTYAVTTTRYVPPDGLTLHLQNPQMVVTVGYQLRPIRDGQQVATRLTCAAQIERVGWLLKPVRPLFVTLFSDALARQLATLKRVIEADADNAADRAG